jgi:hypothetical protein
MTEGAQNFHAIAEPGGTIVALRVLLLVFVLLAAGPLLADQMPFSFTTTGSFGDAAHPQLSFDDQIVPVAGTTVGGAASPLALGSFVLTRPDNKEDVTYTDVPFILDVLFLLPPGIDGGSNSEFDAKLNGTITHNAGNGSLDVVFSPVSKPFTFDDGVIKGSFTFGITNGGITDMDWHTSSPYALTGFIEGAEQTTVGEADAAVPEPGSIVLLVTALGGVVFSLRRKYSV